MKQHLAGVLGFLLTVGSSWGAVSGWLAWRGPDQNGTSPETGLPDAVHLKTNLLWSVDLAGGSTPVIAGNRLYINGYLGDGPDLREVIACYHPETGKKLWEHRFNDFLSDIIYQRYATSSPAIDEETGNVYMQGTQGILAGFTPEGKLLWQRSLMEEFGRLTFPNGRTASPVIFEDLVIVHGITANWGAQGPASDRYYAFDKRTGELVWASTPGSRPKDSSFSHPYIGVYQGKRVLVATTGDGSVICLNVRTGEPIWRVPLAKAGINASVLVHQQERVIAIFGTPYEPGQMVAFRIPQVKAVDDAVGPVEVERSQVELWSISDFSTSTSSPILVGDRIYVVLEKGDLCSLDVQTGKVLWKLKIGIEQRNSCPLYADGRLYVPILDDPDKGQGGGEAGTSGAFYVIQPTDSEGKILSKVTLEGRCFGSPTAYNGKVYLQTTRKLYCFGKAGNNPGLKNAITPRDPVHSKTPAQLQIIPSEVLLRPGGTASFRIRALNEQGQVVQEQVDPKTVRWSSYIPPTARVRTTMKGEFNAEGRLVASPEKVPSAGAYEATLGNIKGYIRARVLPHLPIEQDFESFELTEAHETEPDTRFAYPPLPWIGARFKFEIRGLEGNKVLAKTIHDKFFQRGTVFIGSADASQYTIQADVMSEGNRRKMSEVGLINQRYLIVLKGNDQKLQVTSNQELFMVPGRTDPPNFRWSPKVWYTLKARVDAAADGSGVIRAKAWQRDEPEPSAWTLEVPVQDVNRSGSPGLFGFSPQDVPVYIDNVKVTPN